MTLHFVLPADVDDPASASGGNTYDRAVATLLDVRQLPVAGAWPRPSDTDRAALAGALDALPDGASVLLDGLIACGVPEVVVPRATRLRIAVLVHLPLADEVGLDPAVAAALDAREREVLAAASVVVATSPWAARALADRHGLPHVHAVMPGVTGGPPATPDPAGTRLLCVASVTPRKAQDVLVEALAAVSDLAWTCRCVGPTRDARYTGVVRALIDRNDLADRLRLVGPRSGAPLDAEYASADLLVLPSRAETYGMVVTEALARGVPVLATEVGGIPDALAGTQALLVPPDDVAALSTALRRWLTDAELRDTLRRATASHPHRTWQQCAAELSAALS